MESKIFFRRNYGYSILLKNIMSISYNTLREVNLYVIIEQNSYLHKSSDKVKMVIYELKNI